MANSFTPDQQRSMIAAYTRLPLPEPAIDVSATPFWYTADQMHEYSDAENAALRARLDRLMDVPIIAERDALQSQVRVLREALISFTKSAYIKRQHPRRYANALAALEQTP